MKRQEVREGCHRATARKMTLWSSVDGTKSGATAVAAQASVRVGIVGTCGPRYPSCQSEIFRRIQFETKLLFKPHYDGEKYAKIRTESPGIKE